MTPQPIVEQLEGLGIRRFGGTIEYAGLRQAPPAGALPAAYIVDESEAAGESRLATGGFDQRVAYDFAVILVMDAIGRSESAIDDRLRTLRNGVRDRLAGWKHPDASGPTQFLGGRLLSVDGATLAWATRFRAAYHVRKVG